MPGRFQEVKHPSLRSHTAIKESSPAWVGSVLGGSANCISVEPALNFPKEVPGGDETTGTEIAIWNGLGGFTTGSGFIQAGVNLKRTLLSPLWELASSLAVGPAGTATDTEALLPPIPAI
jgi:hypothetical protein